MNIFILKLLTIGIKIKASGTITQWKKQASLMIFNKCFAQVNKICILDGTLPLSVFLDKSLIMTRAKFYLWLINSSPT